MKLSSVYSTLPPAEKKVADFILANPDGSAHMVINEIARCAGVSVPSVTRLARKLGYSGFMDFRVALASGSSSVKSDAVLPISPEDTDGEFMRKLMIGHMKAVESTLKVLDLSTVSALSERVLNCRRVVWFAVGSCVQLAENVSEGLCRIGIDSVVIDNKAIMRSYAACLGLNDLVFAITRSGKTQATLDCLKIAKEKGSETVLITNLINSPGEAYADHFICTSRQDELYRACGYETGTSICALLESFMMLIERKKGFGFPENRYGTAAGLDQDV
ncbi:MAG: MurR/RpiR family transcriptional regulator [Clostridia bacterium]|nr:MurR/RpiR family transcriptional regulator [Clostridia bacterium]